jgi:uncharacterized protein
MSLVLRDVLAGELDQVTALNNAAGTSILPLDRNRMQRFFDQACYFRVAEIQGHLAGFLIALDQHCDYESPNYQWFRNQYESFTYIDRIVIASNYRRHGLGRIFYADVQSFAEVRCPQLCCEVFLEPRDDAAVLFHGSYGFREVGQHNGSDGRRVALLSKALCSFSWVQQHYGRSGAGIELPRQAWLHERSRSLPAKALLAS